MRHTPHSAISKPTTSTQGILRPHEVGRKFHLRRYPARAALARHVERYWSVHWDLPDLEPYQVVTIPHPCVNLTIMPGLGAPLHGVGTRKSAHPDLTTSTQGILRPHEVGRKFHLRRYPARAALARHVERYWSVHWDLPDLEPYQVETIPHPCVNLTIMPGLGAQLHGVGTRKSAHPLAGKGWVFGVKFRPGGFGAFSGLRAASLTDRSLPLRNVFGAAADEMAAAVLAAPTDRRRIALVDRFLSQRVPPDEDGYDRVLVAI